MSTASALYALVARARRRAWDRPGRRRRLSRPVVSVGSLRVGGSGKTPAVEALAHLLLRMGERPAILSRGYARRRAVEGVVVVSDGERLLADLDRSGDEPLMLARRVPGARVLVSPDRYLSGRLAELRLGATVHVLDDGFQHLPLARDVDLVIVSGADVADGRTMPSGRLRESLDTARLADALIVPDAGADEARQLGDRLGAEHVFVMTRHLEPLRRLDILRESAPLDTLAPAFVVAGIARPDRFVQDVAAAGVTVAGSTMFPDHHRYTARDVSGIVAAARQAGAAVIVTTEKDVMRLLPFRPLALPLAWLPLTVRIGPDAAFLDWLRGRLDGARAAAAGSAA